MENKQLKEDNSKPWEYFNITETQYNDIVAPYKVLLAEHKPSLQEAIEVLCNALREDTTEGSYYYSWQANIAMSIYDEYCRQKGDKDYEESRVLDILEICNIGAKNFLNLLINK